MHNNHGLITCAICSCRDRIGSSCRGSQLRRANQNGSGEVGATWNSVSHFEITTIIRHFHKNKNAKS